MDRSTQVWEIGGHSGVPHLKSTIIGEIKKEILTRLKNIEGKAGFSTFKNGIQAD